jgi:dipeptidyl aminopeptidase/acylaminoacyl peptidase
VIRFAALLLAVPLFAAPPFTIRQVLSSPFPDDLVASPHGDAAAWVLNASGVRNIWVARGPDYHASAITRFTSDDGQEIGEISWLPDTSALVFTRGGGPNGKGEIPNPAENLGGAHQEIWLAPVSGGQPRKLGDGHIPAVSPNGSVVIWVYSGQLWSAPLHGEAKPEQLTHMRGYAEDLAWSPDGDRLAFTSLRGDHSFIGVYSAREKTLRFVDASVDQDQSPSWSPDGKQLAHLRIPAQKEDFPFGPKRTGDPWSIRVVDAATGEAREIWRAHAGMGSVFWPMTAETQLLWGAGDDAGHGNAGRIAFPWEGDGWLHLYSVSAGGGPALCLTPGQFEIEQVAIMPDRHSLVFSSNENDIDRRHLWRVPVAGGSPQRITSGDGIEWAPAILSTGHIALLHSDAKMPGRAAILENNGNLRDLAPETMPADFPAQSLVEPEQVILPAADGLQIHAQLFLPPNHSAGKHPAIIFFHGGSRRQMLLGWHYMFYYHQAYGFNQYLASRGYVVLSVNYRSGIGYGEQFREALHYGATGASEFNDVLGAGLYLRNRTDVDPARIGLWGGSYGGYLTALGLARASDLFAVGVDLHGVHDWNLEIPNFAPSYDPSKRTDFARIAFESSPMASVSTWRSPVLLIQGDDDRNVPFTESVQMAEALRKQGVYFEQLIFPDEIHDFLIHAHWLAAYEAADKFLAKYLKPE